MAACDHIKNSGHVVCELFREDGQVVSWEADNLVVASGLAWIAARVGASVAAMPVNMSHMAIGTNASATQSWYTSLWAEAGRVELAGTGVTGPDTTYAAIFGPGVGSGQITELGIFNSSVAGIMLNRVTFAAQAKGPNDSLRVTWTVKQSA